MTEAGLVEQFLVDRVRNHRPRLAIQAMVNSLVDRGDDACSGFRLGVSGRRDGRTLRCKNGQGGRKGTCRFGGIGNDV